MLTVCVSYFNNYLLIIIKCNRLLVCNSPVGMCAKCARAIMGEDTGCKALDEIYHVDCFSCTSCSKYWGRLVKGK